MIIPRDVIILSRDVITWLRLVILYQSYNASYSCQDSCQNCLQKLVADSLLLETRTDVKIRESKFLFFAKMIFFLGHAQNPTSESVSKYIQGPINVYNASDQRGSSLKMFPVLTRPEILRTCAFLIYSRKIISRVLSPGVTRWCRWDGIIYCHMSSREILNKYY